VHPLCARHPAAKAGRHAVEVMRSSGHGPLPEQVRLHALDAERQNHDGYR